MTKHLSKIKVKDLKEGGGYFFTDIHDKNKFSSKSRNFSFILLLPSFSFSSLAEGQGGTEKNNR